MDKRPALYSAYLHVALLVLMLIGFSNPFKRTIPDEMVVSIEFEAVADERSAPEIQPVMQDVKKPEERPEPKKEPPKPEPEPDPMPTPTSDKPDAAPTSEAVEDAPDVSDDPKPEPEPEIEKASQENDAQAEPIPQLEPTPKPKIEEPTPRPTRRPKSVKALVNLEEKKEKSKPKAKTEPKENSKDDFNKLIEDVAAEDLVESSNDAIPANKVSDKITASELDRLRSHIKKCWIVPHGARNAGSLNVDVELKINPDGTVVSAKIVDTSRMNQDPFYRSAAESARRAVLHPECNPLPLPEGKYEQWKDMTLRFDPKAMLG